MLLQRPEEEIEQGMDVDGRSTDGGRGHAVPAPPRAPMISVRMCCVFLMLWVAFWFVVPKPQRLLTSLIGSRLGVLQQQKTSTD